MGTTGGSRLLLGEQLPNLVCLDQLWVDRPGGSVELMLYGGNQILLSALTVSVTYKKSSGMIISFGYQKSHDHSALLNRHL